jgi:stearoyl-CoA desaturase (delta-9 desaturase)
MADTVPETGTPSEPRLRGSINWPTATFLVLSPIVALTLVPWYATTYGIGLFEILHFVVMCYVTGLGITVGYHRLFAHRSFQAPQIVRVITALAGTATFEQSVLTWASEHRYHHKYVDQDGFPYDPYSIKQGFFHAHVGWLIWKRQPVLPRTNVKDLEKDPFLRFQDRYIVPLMVLMGLVMPTLVGMAWAALTGLTLFHGALAGFIFGGIARVVFVHHGTFFINSLCHYLGRRPYDGESTARDSAIVAFFTYGEGYHNYHHAFEMDYRNGIRAWHFDPGKWVIWCLERMGLASRLGRVPEATVRMAVMREKRRRLESGNPGWLEQAGEQVREKLAAVEEQLEEMHDRARLLWRQYRRLREQRVSRRDERVKKLRAELERLMAEFKAALQRWEEIIASARMQPALARAR